MKKVFLSLAFVAIGTFAMAQKTDKMQKMDPVKMEQKRADHLMKMKTEYNLSDAQVMKIKGLQDQRMAQRKLEAPQRQAERKAKMEMMRTKRTQHNAEMRQIMTPDQYQKWEAKQNQNRQQRGKMVKNNRMHRMHKAK